MMLVVLLALSSCVHEFPEAAKTRNVTITVHHELEWTYQDWTWSRATFTTAGAKVRYIYAVCPTSDPGKVVARYTYYSDDLSLSDFTVDFDIPAGDYTIWVWNDYVSSTEEALYYDAKSLAEVRALHLDQGNDARKDAFVGSVNLKVPKNDLLNVNVSGTINLNRPLAAYAVIANDYDKFLDSESRRRGIPSLSAPQIPALTPANPNLQSLKGYSVKFLYPGYLPSVFDVFSDRPVDVVTGAWFDSEIQGLSATEALLGFDFVIVNGRESAVTIGIDTYGPEGTRIATTGGFNIPLKRSQCTVVRGPFLTSNAHASVGINADFDGVYNIEI